MRLEALPVWLGLGLALGLCCLGVSPTALAQASINPAAASAVAAASAADPPAGPDDTVAAAAGLPVSIPSTGAAGAVLAATDVSGGTVSVRAALPSAVSGVVGLGAGLGGLGAGQGPAAGLAGASGTSSKSAGSVKKSSSRFGDQSSRASANSNTHHPYFEEVGPRNVSSVVDQTATLRCRVKFLGEQKVSWIRKRDLHILTSQIYTYTGDDRFSIIHPSDSDDWDLKIEFVQERDAGTYECQVNTEPKINHAVHLKVEVKDGQSRTATGAFRNTAAQANISGPVEVYVKKGSTISLTCSVNVHSTPPGSVQWYHGDSVVDFDSPRGGISLETERTERGTTSKLLVTRAELSDSGKYTCKPSNANPATVEVHVLNGEHPAAMQRPSSGAGLSGGEPPALCLLVIILGLLLSWR